jgi:citronellol/citronellal dehydrogenase
MKASRKPEIMADAAYVIFNRSSREFTGNFCIDDDVLKSAGKTDLSEYAVDPSQKLMPDFFV